MVDPQHTTTGSSSTAAWRKLLQKRMGVGKRPARLTPHLSSRAYYETMRHVPPVTFIPKTVAEDTTLTAATTQGDKVVIPVPKGTLMGIDTAGLHYNPRYWEDPEAFKPDRFLGEYNHDAFIPFSAGPRSCIGRK